MVLLRKPQPKVCGYPNTTTVPVKLVGIAYQEVWDVFPLVGILALNVFLFSVCSDYLFFCLFLGLSPGSDAQVNAENVRSREQILQTLTDLSRSFQDIADRCLLVLHLEVRQVPPFHFNLRRLQTQILKYPHTHSDVNAADLPPESTQLELSSPSVLNGLYFQVFQRVCLARKITNGSFALHTLLHRPSFPLPRLFSDIIQLM